MPPPQSKAETKKTKKKPADRRAPLDDAKKEEMLAVLIRNKSAYQSVEDVLKVGHLRNVSEGLGLVWKVTQQFYDKHGSLPSKAQINADLHNALKANEALLDDDERTDVDEF